MPNRIRKPIRIVIVHQDALYRDLLRLALEQASGTIVSGVFGNGEELLRAARALEPDVAVIDVDLDGHNGIQLAKRLQKILTGLGIVLLIDDRDAGLLASLPENVVQRWSYLVNKSSHNVTALLRAIQVTHARLLNLSDVEQLMAAPAPEAPLAARFPELTGRQREILGLLAEGFTNRAIAETLHLKEKTIENQLAAIYGKFQMDRDRAVVHPRVWAALHYHQARRVDERSAAD
jgi:DNA-binding NarL/FixJ family response regulator